jgi:hypothetical protein
MKTKQVIAYFILAVYSLVLAHSFIPHDHCVHFFDRTLVVCVHEDGSHAENHADHDFPHHDESQYADAYTGNAAAGPFSQDIPCPAVDCSARTPDLAPPMCALRKLTPCFVSLKIPVRYSESSPLRAPPAV